MIGHSITTNMSDGSAELLAVDFATGRVCCSWGSGYTTHVSVYQWAADKWGGAWHYVNVPQTWRTTPVAAVADPHFGVVESRASELEVFAHSHGPSIYALQAWLREEYVRLRAENDAKSARAAEIREACGGTYPRDVQDALRGLDFDTSLPTKLLALSGSITRVRVLGMLLSALRGALVHGSDLFEFAEEARVAVSGPADFDTIVYVAYCLDLVRPYDYDPRTRLEQAGQLTKAQESTWRRQGKGSWSKLGCIVGSQFWLYSKGPRFDVVPRFQ